MKTKLLLSVMISCFLFWSCDEDMTSDLHGTWKANSVSGFTFPEYFFEPGTIKWTFNENNNKLNIVNNYEGIYYSDLETGIYDYEIRTTPDGVEYLEISSGFIRNFTLNGGDLTISPINILGPTLNFTK